MKYKNNIMLDLLAGNEVERPPVWLMRQAGRILPQYRAIRSSLAGFKDLVKNPELAATVSVQPVDELDVDACIIFSDILVIPEAMGLNYEMVEKKGPLFPQTIVTEKDIDHLTDGVACMDSLDYVSDAIVVCKQMLEDRVPLIGFCGAPWTIFTYMIEGQGSKTFSKAKAFMNRHPEASHKLLEKITDTSIAYLKKKVRAGVDLVQIFDSWAGVLSREDFLTYSLPYMERIAAELQKEVPVIVFARGAHHSLLDIAQTSSDVMGLDWTIDVTKAREVVGEDIIFQGNLDPCKLYGPKEAIAESVSEIISRSGRKHIMNLGHGVYPDTELDKVKHFVNSVKSFKYSN